MLAVGEGILTTMISNASSIFTAVGTLGTTIVGNEYLSLGVSFFVAGGIVGILGRVLKRG